MTENKIDDYFDFIKTKVAILKHRVDAYCLSLNVTREELIADFMKSLLTIEMLNEIKNDKDKFHELVMSRQYNDRHQLGLCYVVYDRLMNYIEAENLIETFNKYSSLIEVLNNINNRRINKLDKSNTMREYAKLRLANDPKQKALDEIKSHYELAKNQFKRRGYTAQFVKEMAALYPVIESIKTIERLVTKLNRINKYPLS